MFENKQNTMNKSSKEQKLFRELSFAEKVVNKTPEVAYEWLD